MYLEIHSPFSSYPCRQQPGAQPHTPPSHLRGGGRGGGGGGGGGGGSGSKSSGSSSRGRHSNDSGQGRRYRPY